MSPSRRAAAAGLAGALLFAAGSSLLPAATLGHAIGEVFTLPVPLWLYLAGAALAVAASFVISVIAVRPAGAVPHYPRRAVSPALARVASIGLKVIGLAWWFGAILAGYLVDPISPLPAVLFWIGIWVGLPIAAVLIGNPWPSLSPFRTVYSLVERAIGGGNGIQPLVDYPPRLRRWPAVILLFVGVWCELILPESSTPVVVANLLVGYTILTLAGMTAFGSIAWLRNVELFEVLLGWFGRVGPVGRRTMVPQLCEGCADGCEPTACVDCPECVVAADTGEQRVELRPWFTGLTEVRAAGWSDAAFIVLALGGVTFDGLQETSFWNTLLQPVFDAAWEAFGALNAVLVTQTVGLIALWLVFLAAFALAAGLTRALHDPGRATSPLGMMVGSYAATLLPIAGGYLVAHYLTVVIQAVTWLPGLLADDQLTVAPNLAWIPTSLIWYLSVGSIVLGHVVGVVLAHRLALRDAPRRAIVAGLPLVLLMVGYTVLSLWIIAAPITVDPATPSAAIGR